MKIHRILAATTVAALMASSASAAIVYNNGGPTTSGGNETVAWTQSEDFSFATNTTIGGAGVYLVPYFGSWDGGFQYDIFGDSSGTPGALLTSGNVTATVTNTGSPTCCGTALLYAFNFTSAFNALAGTTYHLGIHAGVVGNNNRDNLYWVNTGSNSTNTGYESAGSTFNNWYNNGAEHAFYLTDGAGGVPEPAAWGLMIMGFGLSGVALRSRRRMATAAV